MDKTQQRIKIAEACGYTEVKPIYSTYKFERGDATEPKLIGIMGKFPDPTNCQPWLPDYLNDLNAMHEAEKVLTKDQDLQYHLALTKICTGYGVPEFLGSAIRATAAQRAKAFLRTLGKWEDAK